ncbi:MAG: glycoside hydrolase family 3 protein, partial [Cyclobacteriaceae bacterium]
IGQLFQVATFSNRDNSHEKEILELIRRYHIGGLTFFQGDPLRQAVLTNKYQLESDVPLFVNIDAEWGLAMRLNGGMQFPYQMALGALKDDTLVADMAACLARHCRRLGVQSPLAPVLDINNNPKNPVINFRSFGEDREKVATKAMAFVQALQAQNILAVGKHFPGHGDTAADSHMELPVLLHDLERIQNTELYPFKKLIDSGIGAIMTAHLQVPSLDNRPNMPATLSERISGNLLREQLGFKGLVITDALDMKGITNHYKPGQADKLALMAGNDIITNSMSVKDGVMEVQKAIESGELTMDWLDAKVRRILGMKAWTGLNNWNPIETEGLLDDLNDDLSVELNKVLAEKSISCIKNSNKKSAYPVHKPIMMASLHIICKGKNQTDKSMDHHLKLMHNSGGADHFCNLLQEKTSIKLHFLWDESTGKNALWQIIERLKSFDHVVLAFHGVNVKPFNRFDIPKKCLKPIAHLFEQNSVSLIVFGNAYALKEIKHHDKAERILITYQESIYTHEAVVKWLDGGIVAEGNLPVSINSTYVAGGDSL